MDCGLLNELLDRHSLGEVARLIDVFAAEMGDVVGEQLERDGDGNGRDELMGRRNPDHVIGRFGWV
jgi:hypothetical protein